MNILLLNTFDNYGGASVACQRLRLALQKHTDLKVRLLAQSKNSDDANTTGVAESYWAKKWALAKLAMERAEVYPFIKSADLKFSFSPATWGYDISRHEWVKQADILHLHWINFGFLSLPSLQKLIAMRKPMVWTLHDMWAFTGGCHYTGYCRNFEENCGNCNFLKYPSPKDWSYKIHQQKKRILENADIQIVTCSAWLAEEVRKSSLLKKFDIINIPNPIDTEVFKPQDKLKIRQELNLPSDKFLILFGAMNVADKRKGFAYLQEALQRLHSDLSFQKIQPETIELVVFGKAQAEVFASIPFKINYLGVINSEKKLAEIYGSADTFVLPSLEDNLPNTVMEALACGTPAIAFNIGGVPEMIIHQTNGFLAPAKNGLSLATSLKWLYEKWCNNSDYQVISDNSRQHVLQYFHEKVVSTQYQKIYEKAYKAMIDIL
jgi:glycosyltransferase involved in cell wall biosynthesis